MQKKLALSILSVDPQDYQKTVSDLENEVDILHFDIMDGHFVPNEAMGVDVAKNIKTSLVKWAHLMVQNPEREIPKYIEAGVDWITFHVEAAHEPTQLIEAAREKGINIGIAINPHTHVEEITNFLNIVDHVLIMTVEPGQGGQNFQSENLEKIREIRRANPNLEIAVDGGISATTLSEVIKAGANVFVVGSAIVRNENPIAACRELKRQMQ